MSDMTTSNTSRDRADRDVITHLFGATSIAVIGATTDGNKPAGRTLRYLKTYGYSGDVYPVHPTHENVFGLACYPSVSSLPATPDLAIIALSATSVATTVAACEEIGIPTAMVFASGFAEAGDAGAILENQLKSVISSANIRVLGPNCNGTIGALNGQATTFMSGIDDDLALRDDGVAFVTQSGAMGAFIFHQAQTSGLGLGRFASTGNEVDISAAELVDELAHDPHTKAILVYLEGINNVSEFRNALVSAQERNIPVVVMKVGRSAAGAQAVASHTGALVGADDAFDGLLRQHNAVRATNIDQLLDFGRIFGQSKRPKGRRLSVVTLSGGAGVLLADAADEYGLTLAPWSGDATQQLRHVLPEFASVHNPIDLTGALINDTGLLREALHVVTGHSDTDVIVVMLGNMQTQEAEACRIIVEAAACTDKPIVTVWVGGTGNAITRLAEHGLPAFTEPVRAIRAIAELADRECLPPVEGTWSAESYEPALDGGGDNATIVDEVAAKDLLKVAGIQTVDELPVQTPDEAKSAASRIGYPVVLKLLSNEVSHKSDLGLVWPRLHDECELEEAASSLLARATRLGLNDKRLVVQQMVSSQTELILGMRRDFVFGPVVAFGIGGVLTEVAADVQVRVPPLTPEDCYSMIDGVRNAALLKGPRGRPAVNRAALVRQISHFSDFVIANADTIDSVEINPLLVDSAGVPVAVDALMIRRR